jgi:hypothetical protein
MLQMKAREKQQKTQLQRRHRPMVVKQRPLPKPRIITPTTTRRRTPGNNLIESEIYVFLQNIIVDR